MSPTTINPSPSYTSLEKRPTPGLLSQQTSPLTFEGPPTPRSLVAGYVLGAVNTVRLALRIRGRDPDSILPPTSAERAKKPDSIFVYDLLHPEPGSRPFVDINIIKRSLRKYMKGRAEDLVDVWYTEKDEVPATIIITQGCFLIEPHQLSGPLPVATEGKQEELVRQWLESKGDALLTNISPYPCSNISHRC